eukprot:3825567-Amphidinium_carterae.1
MYQNQIIGVFNPFRTVRRSTACEGGGVGMGVILRTKAWAQLDLTNATTEVNRNVVQLAVRQLHCQRLNSCSGVQQGDPPGPLLFSIAIHVHSDGSVQEVGLNMNLDNCVVVPNSPKTTTLSAADFPAFACQSDGNVVLRGAVGRPEFCNTHTAAMLFRQSHILALASQRSSPVLAPWTHIVMHWNCLTLNSGRHWTDCWADSWTTVDGLRGCLGLLRGVSGFVRPFAW